MPRNTERTRGTRGARSLLHPCCLLAATIAVVASPAAAHGATAKLTDHALLYTAAAGESNHVTITTTRIEQRGGKPTSGFKLTDSLAPLVAGAGCTSNTKHAVTCPAARVTVIVAKADDRRDTLVNETAMRSRLDGGKDNDTVIGGSAGDVLYGGSGEDTLNGRGGNDAVKTRGRWRDAVSCGSGADTVFTDLRDIVDPLTCESVLRAPK